MYDNAVDRLIYHFGASEKPEVELMVRLAEAFDGALVDVGANVGGHALYVAPYVEFVHAIEPWPPVVERLRRNIAANPGLTNVAVHPVGYGNEPGSMDFYPPPDGLMTIGSFNADSLPQGRPDPIKLPILRADDHLRDVGAGRIGIVKCDIEGYERFAFEGMRETLWRDRPAGGVRAKPDRGWARVTRPPRSYLSARLPLPRGPVRPPPGCSTSWWAAGSTGPMPRAATSWVT